MDFVHLHLHSVFSFLDSTCRLDRLVARVRELGMGAVAITDHDGLYGVVRFYQEAKRAGIKPILGVELTTEGGYHLPLIAISRRGYANLSRMVTAGHLRVLREASGVRDESELNGKILRSAQNDNGVVTGGHFRVLRETRWQGQAPAQQRVGPERVSCPSQQHKERRDSSSVCGGLGMTMGAQWRKAPRCSLSTIAKCGHDVIALSGCRFGEVQAAVRRGDMEGARRAVRRFQGMFGRDRFFIELTLEEGERDRIAVAKLAALAQEMGAPTVATANVHYLTPEEAPIQEVLACIQTLTRRNEWHPIRRVGAERYLKPPQEMAQAFAHHPEALRNTIHIAERCEVDLELGKLHFPHFRMRDWGKGQEPSSCPTQCTVPDWFPKPDEEVEGEPAERLLEWLCWEGARRRYRVAARAGRPRWQRVGQERVSCPRPVAARLRHELRIIRELGLCEYFLVVWDIVEEARARGIRCSGRGSAADSLVSYVLGITDVDPIGARLLFERFLNPERRGMPDIDIDFDARRRDEMLDYVADRYGLDHTGMVATINTYHARSAIREVGKAIELPEELTDHISKSLPYIPAGRIRQAIATLPELRGSGFNSEALKELLDICEVIDGFPRHLSVHLGGVVISRDPITDIAPLEVSSKGVVVCQFDKDDLEALGLVKMDLLGLRNLSAIEEAVTMIRETRGVELDLERLPLDDEKTFRLIRSARTVGVFQLESPGMRGLLSRLQPTRFDDLIAQISLFRPGPMQADMIKPFLARRHREEPVIFLHPAVKPALAETYGVILYQEQVLEVASALAGLSLGQSDSFRRAMTHDRSPEGMEKIRETFLEGCRRRGVKKPIAQEAFRQLSAFAAYGFCKAHAASFAILAYQTAYLKAHYPAEFLAAILSNQPMGFYPPEVILQEARHFGVEVRPPDINRSRDRYWVEEGAIRVGLAQVAGLSAAGLEAILAAREAGGCFCSLRDFCARTGLPRPMVENLIRAGALDSLGSSRRALLWELSEISNTGARRRERAQQRNGQLALLGDAASQESVGQELVSSPRENNGIRRSAQNDHPSPIPELPPLTEREVVASELAMTGVSLSRHPLYFAREQLHKLGVISRAQLEALPDGKRVRVAGIVIARQRPPIRSGHTVIFITLEDETGLLDVTVFERVYQRWGKVIFSSSALIVDGTLQKRGRYGTVIIGEGFQGFRP
jgi:error-prone DNA polymerase